MKAFFFCSLCLEEGIISNKYCGNSTSGMIHHLRTSHKINNEKEIESSLKRTKGLFDRSCILQDNKASKALFTRRTALMLCRTLMPFSIVENEGFKDWMLNNNFVQNVDDIPNKNSVLNSALNDVYNSAESLMKKELFTASKVITLQLDYYTSVNGCVPYITLAVQYLNENFEMVTFTLATEKFERPHSAVRTGEKVTQVLETYGLHDRIII
ncbi:CLUMA_CG017421, isoform A, partial [Clunio marinus]